MQQLTKNILTKAAGFPAVAFDVFGTLLNRDVKKPTDLFALMEETGSAQAGFCARRIKAEVAARNETDGEVTLSKIYAQEPLLGISEEAECEAELAVATTNEAVFEAADACHRRGKKVFAISDMYLPKQQLERMLMKCGYDFLDGVFVSAEYGVQKRSGKLFQHFLTQTGLKNTEVLFVGDDLRADVCGAALAKIRAYRLPAMKRIKYLEPGTSPSDGALYAFINNRLNEMPPAQQVGYEVLGPLAVGFAQWIHAEYSRGGKDATEQSSRMVWLARDMFCVRMVYQLLYPTEDRGIYLKVSRKSLIPALLRLPMNEENLELLADALPRERLSVKQIIAYCGFKQNCLSGYSAQMTVDLKTRPLIANTKKFLQALVAYSKTEPGRGSAGSGQTVRTFLEEQGINSDGLTLVDIGSGGTTQRILEKLCGITMQGRYLACDERLLRHYDKQHAKTFLFEGKVAPSLYWSGQQMLEKLISEPCGATIGYQREQNKVLPVIEDVPNEDARASKMLCEIQKGMIHFTQDWAGSFCRKCTISPKQAIAPFLELLNRPSLAHARLLGTLTVEDGGTYPLAKPKARRYYLSHPKKLASDFEESRWKMGFLKRLLRVSLPYGKIYTELKSKLG